MKLKTIGKVGCSLLLISLSIQAQLFKPQKEVIDLYTKIKCYGYQSECYGQDDFWYEYFSPIKKETLKEKGDSYIFNYLYDEIKKSKWVDKTVVLAFDQVYDQAGNLNKKESSNYIPNRFVYEHSKNLENILLGASVHPYRSDLINKVDQYAHHAALFYVDPVKQQFDLNSPQMELLASKLSVAGVPLMIEMNQKEGYQIDKILQTGVKVILAGQWMRSKGTDLKKFDYLTSRLALYSNLYASVDALPIFGTIIDFYSMVIFSAPWKGKLVYGSGFPFDHPMIYSSWLYPKLWGTPFVEALNQERENRFDYTVLFKRASDTRYETLYRGKELIRN